MSPTCPECSAPLSDGQACINHFHDLLLLEGDIPGGPGELLHFLAVAAYNLQHPDSINLTFDALIALHLNLGDVLDSRATIAEIRHRTRQAANGATRVTRRPDDPPTAWHRGAWPSTVADTLRGGVDGYADRVYAWAHSIRETLDSQLPPNPTRPQ